METSYNYLHAGKKREAFFASIFVFVLALLPYAQVRAEGLSITIAPPLFQLSLQPGETWASGITVVNNNAYDVTLFAEPVLFKPSGESGTPVFVDPPNNNSEGPDASTLAGWITLPGTSFTIPREGTYTVPLVIDVPGDAIPGGHYAAILIGNKPPGGSVEGSTVNVTSSIATLIFLSVSGDVSEVGRIRDFVTEQSVYGEAEARLSLRFENQGNVHILPQGNIVIYNMFGKERGVIPVNHQKDYGTVLPGSIRKYEFAWESDVGFWDIGRYRAEATVQYGKETKHTVLATTYFYILPIRPFLEIIGGVLAFLVFFGWGIRTYVRRALALEASRLQLEKDKEDSGQNLETKVQEEATIHTSERVTLGVGTLIQPIRVGLVDLRRASLREKQAFEERLEIEEQRKERSRFGLFAFFTKYKYFFLFVFILSLGTVIAGVLLKDLLMPKSDYRYEELRPNAEESYDTDMYIENRV